MVNKIIPALDVKVEQALELIKKLCDRKDIAGFKVGSLLAYEETIQVIEEFKDLTKIPIIFDGQKLATDIPEEVKKQVEEIASAGADQIIACPMGGGSVTLKAFADECIHQKVTPICVIKMTHPGSEAYLKENSADLILQDALNFGFKHFVYPATKPDILKAHRGFLDDQKDITIMATGFKAQGGVTTTLRDLGVTQFIAGRAIYDAKDPVQAVINLSREIN